MDGRPIARRTPAITFMAEMFGQSGWGEIGSVQNVALIWATRAAATCTLRTVSGEHCDYCRLEQEGSEKGRLRRQGTAHCAAINHEGPGTWCELLKLSTPNVIKSHARLPNPGQLHRADLISANPHRRVPAFAVWRWARSKRNCQR
jgi:hypothetical protein